MFARHLIQHGRWYRDGHLGQGSDVSSHSSVHPQRSGMKQEKGWCKRRPDRKVFREVLRVVIQAWALAPGDQLR